MSEPLLPVAEALSLILAGVEAMPAERVPIAQAFGRTLARDLAATRTQPPVAMSAMDGYALRLSDLDDPARALSLVGESKAGQRFARGIGPGETVRIFTGAPLPEGADAILIQEDAVVTDGIVRAGERPSRGRFIRRAGLDFSEGEVLLRGGTRLGATQIALAAAMNHGDVSVTRRPVVAIIATGDELVAPGSPVGPDQIVASNGYAVAAFVTAAGGVALDLGIVPDDLAALERALRAARDAGADVLVTLGGASVGDHDLVKPALAAQGMSLDFWRIAMRPGKPLLFGRLERASGRMAVIGLPGNPVSSIVCGTLFLLPLLRALAGDPTAGADRSVAAITGIAMPANDARADYMRATVITDEAGRRVATPSKLQDSSMLKVLAEAEALLIRPPLAPAVEAGAACRILPLHDGW